MWCSLLLPHDTKCTHFYGPRTSKNAKNNLQYEPSYDITMRQTSAAASFTSHETAFPVTKIVPRRTSAKPDARGLSRWCRILNRHPRGESGNRLTEASVRAAPATDIHSIGIQIPFHWAQGGLRARPASCTPAEYNQPRSPGI